MKRVLESYTSLAGVDFFFNKAPFFSDDGRTKEVRINGDCG